MPPAADRPEKRVLVRWSDDLDKSVLLAIQYACNEGGVRIPFDRVAELMGPKFSNGAIVQHLAKLRAKMVDANLEDVPIPPPLKKGMTTKEPSKIYSPGNKRKKSVAVTGATGAAAALAPATPPARKTTKAKGRKIKKEASDDESEDEPDFYDSDEEYGAPKKKSKKVKKSPVKQEKVPDAGLSPKTVKADSDGEGVKDEGKEDSPGMNTRGRRLDYSQMNDAEDEETEEDEAADVQYEEATDDPAATPAEPVPSDSDFNGLPTPEEQVKTGMVSTPNRPTALTAPPPVQSQRYSYGTASTPAQQRYPAIPGFGAIDYQGGAGSQHYPSHYDYNNSFNNRLGTPFHLTPYSGQNWSFDGNAYNMPAQTRPVTGNHNPRGSMSSPQTPARRQSTAMAVNYDTPPYTRNNSTVTLDSNSSIANSFSAPTPSQSQAQKYTAVTASAGVPSAMASSFGVEAATSTPTTQAPSQSQSQATSASDPTFNFMVDVYMPALDYDIDEDFKNFMAPDFGEAGDFV